MVVTGERKKVMARVRKPNEKMYTAEGVKAARASWAESGNDGRRGGVGRHGLTWAGWVRL
jgi:hypothetical protein